MTHPTTPTNGARPYRWRRLQMTAAVAMAFMLVIVAGCSGLGPEDQPRVVDTGEVPEALLDPGTTQSPPDLDPGTGGVEAELFLFLTTAGDEFLVPCQVPTASGGSVEARSRAVIERLINLEPGTDCPNNLTTAVPSNLVVLSVRVVFEPTGNILELNLSKDALGAIEATQQRRAIAQMVFTATDVPGVSAVRFFADGSPTSVPVEDGTASSGQAVSEADFPRLSESLALWLEFLEEPVTTPAPPVEPTPIP